VFAARKMNISKVRCVSPKMGFFHFWRYTAYFGDKDDLETTCDFGQRFERFLEIRTIFGEARAIFGDKDEFWRHAFYR
jgi:hypothetical protein